MRFKKQPANEGFCVQMFSSWCTVHSMTQHSWCTQTLPQANQQSGHQPAVTLDVVWYMYLSCDESKQFLNPTYTIGSNINAEFETKSFKKNVLC